MLTKMKSNVKLSPFLHFFKLEENNYAAYNSLNLKKFFCNEETVNKIKNLDFKDNSTFSKKLYKKRFIINKELTKEEEINNFIKEQSLDLNKPHFKVFYMIVTTACNLRCKYCYLSTMVNEKPRHMTKETAKKCLEYFYNYMKKIKIEKPRLVIYGGEPLLNKEVTKFIISEIRKKTKTKEIPPTTIVFISNGVLLDKEMAKFLKENKVLVAISLDGPKEINDKNRIYRNNKGTYDDIIKAINLLNKEGIKPTISCTITKNNVNKLDEIIPWMYNKFEMDSLGLNLLAGEDCTKKSIKQLSKESAKKAIETFKICREKGIYEDTVTRKIKAFVEETPIITPCAAAGNEISVDPDGNLGTCPAFLGTEMFPITLDDNINLEKNKEFIKWGKITPLLRKGCHDCIAIGLCGGGCPYNAHHNHGDVSAKDDFYCEYAKDVTKWMLKDAYKIIKKNE